MVSYPIINRGFEITFVELLEKNERQSRHFLRCLNDDYYQYVHRVNLVISSRSMHVQSSKSFLEKYSPFQWSIRLVCFDMVARKSMSFAKSLQPLSHRRSVGDLSIFYRYFNGHCSQEIRDIIPVPLRRVRTTRSSTHSHPFQVSLPTHELYLTNHHSSQEHAIHGTSCLLLAFLSPTTCHLPNLM